MTDPTCPDCGTRMQRGFSVAEGNVQSEWFAGDPQRVTLFGHKMSPVRTRGLTMYKIVAYRCEQCGLLRSYAPQPES